MTFCFPKLFYARLCWWRISWNPGWRMCSYGNRALHSYFSSCGKPHRSMCIDLGRVALSSGQGQISIFTLFLPSGFSCLAVSKLCSWFMWYDMRVNSIGTHYINLVSYNILYSKKDRTAWCTNAPTRLWCVHPMCTAAVMTSCGIIWTPLAVRPATSRCGRPALMFIRHPCL